MRRDAPIKLVSQLLDLPLIDKDGRWCGVVDDVEFDGTADKETSIAALLVGPGTYKARLPQWAYWVVRKIAGERIARVPYDQIDNIASAVHLRCRAEDLKLNRVEDEVRKWIPRRGAL